MKLLLIEDDKAMREALERALKRQGWAVQACAEGREGLALWRRLSFDVVILDLSLPGCDGLEILRQAREQSLITPVLILTARGTVGDRVLGLNTGADDYLAKPFDLDELQARLHALVRAQQRSLEHVFETKSRYGRQENSALRYEKESGVFYSNGAPLELSPRESSFLAVLYERMGQAVAKERVFERVFAGESQVQADAMDVIAYRLRKKIAGRGYKLTTLRGLGYLLQPE